MILVIDKSRKNANSIAELFFYMGFIAHAITPGELAAEFTPKYHAIIFSDPEGYGDYTEYVRNITKYIGKTPVFAISDAPLERPDVFALVFRNNVYSTTVATGIINYCKSNLLYAIGDYEIGCVNASAGLDCAYYYSKKVILTKSELKVVRFFLASYPSVMSAKAIIKYIFPKLTFPDSTALRNHICSVNKKFRDVIGRNLIVNIPGTGYILNTNSVRQELSMAH